MAQQVCEQLQGAGIWGVEFFIADDGVYFSELSPRPHDTGMVTLANTQNFNEFELHARAVLGLPIPEIEMIRYGASAVILSDISSGTPAYSGLEEAAQFKQTDFKIFGKPLLRRYRRMGVALSYGALGSSTDQLRQQAKQVADCIVVSEKST